MSFIHSIQSMLPRPENRSRDQIARDLEDEFSFHLEMKAHRLMAEAPGLGRAEARTAARRMFGNVETIKSECQRIALRERIMLQRVNLVLMIVVMLVVIAVGAQVYITQRYNTLALQAITADLARMKFEAASAAREQGGASSTGNNSAADVVSDAARVLVEGDVAGVGWHPIDMDRGTRLADLLQQLKVRDDQWITYRHTGWPETAAVPVKSFLGGGGGMVLRPNDELTILNQVPVEIRRTYYMSQLRTSGDRATNWHATQPDGSTWHVRIPAGRLETSTLMREGDDREWSLAFATTGVDIIAIDADRGYMKLADWDVVNDQLILDFSNLRDDPRAGVRPSSQHPAPMPDIKGRVAFDRSTDDSAFVQSARAAAVGDFVVRLFALADPNDPNLNQTIRDFLDAEEKGLDQKYAGDPATAGMIRELIAARRKIVEADANALRAATAELQAEAVSDFLKDMLASTDTTAPSISVSDVLDNASKRIDEQFADNPELKAQMRERIAEAQKNLAEQPASRPHDVPWPASLVGKSPFLSVRWRDNWTPIVGVQDRWYELVSVEGVSAPTIVQLCRERAGDSEARKVFSENVLQAVTELSESVIGDTVQITVKDLASGSVISIAQATISEDNHRKTLAENAAATAAGKAFPEWTDGGN